MIENIHGLHHLSVRHHVEANYQIVDGKYQLVVNEPPTAIELPTSSRFLNIGDPYLRRKEEITGPHSTRTIYVPRQHGVNDGYDHEARNAEVGEMERFRTNRIRTIVPVSREGSEAGLRNLD